MDTGTKQCPDCAEDVKAAARVCRYCGYRFVDRPDQAPRSGSLEAERPPSSLEARSDSAVRRRPIKGAPRAHIKPALIVAVGSAALLGSLYLPWYDLNAGHPSTTLATSNAWEALTVVDVVLCGISVAGVIAALWLLVPVANGARDGALAIWGLLTVLAWPLVIFRWIKAPGDLAHISDRVFGGLQPFTAGRDVGMGAALGSLVVLCIGYVQYTEEAD